MDFHQTTELVGKILVIVTSILVVFDIYLYLNKTEGDTISNILKNWVYDKFFFISYLWGVLAGHFFLGTKTLIFPNTYSLLIVINIALILLLIGMVLKKKVKPLGQMALLIFGTGIGHFFWSLQ